MSGTKPGAADALTDMVNAANPDVPYIVIVLSGKDVIMCTSMDDETADATLRKCSRGHVMATVDLTPSERTAYAEARVKDAADDAVSKLKLWRLRAG